MIELNINNLTKFYGANKIFERISFEVKTGERIGLIGTNGCGKTTLMKILMGVEDYKEGNISFRKDTRVGYLNQISFFEARSDAFAQFEATKQSEFSALQVLWQSKEDNDFDVDYEAELWKQQLKRLVGSGLKSWQHG